MTIANNGLEIFSVRVAKTVGPRVRPQSPPLFVPCMRKPSQRDDPRVDYTLIGHLLGLLESLDQTGRCPGILIDDLLLDHRHMHDGEDAGLLEVLELDFFVVRE